MAGTFSRSWQLVKESAAVLRDNTGLVVFPVVSGICTIVLTISFFVPLFFLFDTGGDEVRVNPLAYVLVFLLYLVNYFVVIFFNCGLVWCVRRIFYGQQTSFSEGMGEAWKHAGTIFSWALISATVGMLLQAIREKAGWLGNLASGLLGLAWNLLTFFVVPVLVFEGAGPVDSIKRSGSIFKQTWGESVVGSFSLGAVFFLLGLLGAVPILLGIATGSAVFIIGGAAVALVYWFILAIVSASLNGIYRTALYEYATTGRIAGQFSQQAIVGAFSAKPQRKKLFG